MKTDLDSAQSSSANPDKVWFKLVVLQWQSLSLRFSLSSTPLKDSGLSTELRTTVAPWGLQDQSDAWEPAVNITLPCSQDPRVAPKSRAKTSLLHQRQQCRMEEQAPTSTRTTTHL